MADRDENGRFAEGHKDQGAGRPPKKYSITSKLREIGGEPFGDGRESRLEHLARTYWDDAEGGSKEARKEIADRLEGKPKERVEHEGETVVRILFDDEKRNPAAAAETEGALGEPG